MESPVNPMNALRHALKSQYHAALAMLRQTLEQCPDDLWLDTGYRNAFWRLAYHTLFYTHLYLQQNEESFHPWKHHHVKVQFLDVIPVPAEGSNTPPPIPKPYTREQVLQYLEFCDEMVDAAVDELDLSSLESGFSWYTNISKLEHQIMNIRHLQHGAAQLADRLRAKLNVGTDWLGGEQDLREFLQCKVQDGLNAAPPSP